MYLHERQTAYTFLGLQLRLKNLFTTMASASKIMSHFNLSKVVVTIYVDLNPDTKLQQKENQIYYFQTELNATEEILK